MSLVITTALQLGCVYGLIVLALFLSYRVLDIADLSTDGCFVLGMAVSVSLCAQNHPVLGIIMGILAGGLAGYVTAFQQTHLGIPSIIAGIVTNTGLYTINLAVMGWHANLSLLKNETIFSLTGNHALILSGLVLGLCMLFMRWFLSTRLGLSIRATGDNKDMVSASSIDPRYTITVGLVISNMFTALSGAVVGQMRRSADINAGTGIVVVGLASLIIGETVINGRKSVGRNILACFAGSAVYRLIYAFVLQTKIIPVECLKLMTALIVALAIAMPAFKDKAALARRMGRNKSC